MSERTTLIGSHESNHHHIVQAEQRQRVLKAVDRIGIRSKVGLIVGDLLIAMEVKERVWS